MSAHALREAGLLRERATPHGLGKDTAKRTITLLRHALDLARDLGADVRGSFDKIRPINALPHNRIRPATGRGPTSASPTSSPSART